MCCVQISWNLADGKWVKSCVAYLTKNFAWLSSCRCCAYRGQNLPGSILIQIGSLSAELWPNTLTPPKRTVKWVQYLAEAYSFEPNHYYCSNCLSFVWFHNFGCSARRTPKSDTSRTLHYIVREVSLFGPPCILELYFGDQLSFVYVCSCVRWHCGWNSNRLCRVHRSSSTTHHSLQVTKLFGLYFYPRDGSRSGGRMVFSGAYVSVCPSVCLSVSLFSFSKRYVNKKLSYRRGTARRAKLVILCYVSRGVWVRSVKQQKWLSRSFNGIGNNAIP